MPADPLPATTDFLAWALAMPYLQRVHTRFFGDVGFREWLEALTAELVASGALGRDGTNLFNI